MENNIGRLGDLLKMIDESSLLFRTALEQADTPDIEAPDIGFHLLVIEGNFSGCRGRWMINEPRSAGQFSVNPSGY